MSRSGKLLQQELVSVSHLFYARGWSLATSSNFSLRIDDDHVLITASGKDKGTLTEEDTMVVDLAGKPSTESSRSKPSAETRLHCELYRFDRSIGAVLHTHSLYATLFSQWLASDGQLVLSGYEMLKALRGVATHEHTEIIPIFANDQDMNALSQVMLQYLREHRNCHAFLIERHGLYTWGQDMAEARHHIEAFEFLFECEYRKSKTF